MDELVVTPNRGINNEDSFVKKQKSLLPSDMKQLIKNVLSAYNYDEGRSADFTRYVLDSDIDMALEDCIPMKVFFGMCGNKYEQKEEAADHILKTMVEAGDGGKDKITIQKGRIKSTKKYKDILKRKLHYARLKKDSRTLEKAMEMRKDLAQTRSANYRTGLKGPY